MVWTNLTRISRHISRHRDRQHAESFLEHLNSLSDDHVYTIEHPALDGTLPFLDILLHPDLSTSVYRKPTHTDSYTHCSTSSPQSTKDSLISSLTRRAYDICSPQHLPHELEHIRTVLLDNGYPLSRIELVMRRTKHSIDHPASAPIQSDKQSAKVFIPYYPHVNKQISSILHRHSVSSACTSNKNLRDLLSSTKSRQPALQTSNVIYQIPCKDCSATYCRQTSPPLHKRITEHERYTRPAYSHATDLQQSSALAQHAHASGHQIDFSSGVILAKLQHQQQLDLVEHAAITVLETSLNRNHAAQSINPQWQPILQSISEQFHPISITWTISPFTLVTPCLLSSLSLHLTCIYHCTYVSYHLTSTHHSPSHISYFQYLSVGFIFISLADDGCNTAIESLKKKQKEKRETKLIVYFVSFTVVIFTILNLTRS